MSTKARQTYKQSEIYETLVDEHDIFDNYIDCFVFAATVGYHEGRIETENYEGDAEMLWMHFSSHDLYRAAAASIAYQHTKNPEALTNPELQLKVLAKFAAGGAEILEEKFGDVKGTSREGILNYIKSHSSEEERGRENEMLKEIARSFDDQMFQSS